MTYKTIFSGQLEFGNARSYDKVFRLYEHRFENYYKSDILLKAEDTFVEESISLHVPRFIGVASVKTWRNTLNLLEYVAQYAVAGDLYAWMLEDGKILDYRVIEPSSDKAAVQAYLQGRELIKEEGKENEAKEALSRAIEKFERHALAYERRGYVNYCLRNYEDALYDYTKSIDINPNKSASYLGRALVKIAQEDLSAAITDLEKAIKTSIPLQPVYWKSRRVKAECHTKLGDHKSAAFELKLFSNRKFTDDNPNYKWRRKVLYDYGKSLMELEQYQEAVDAFNRSFDIASEAGGISQAQILVRRGLALQKAGKSGFVKDWQDAADQGSEQAAKLLEESV